MSRYVSVVSFLHCPKTDVGSCGVSGVIHSFESIQVGRLYDVQLIVMWDGLSA